MSKKYYWLKLKRDFFKRHDIRIVEGLPNGKEYLLFYLKLLVESIDHEGALRFSDTIPYNEQMLSVITDTNVDIVRSAMKLFTELKMIEVLDDATIYMAEVNTLIGSETRWAEKKRVQRQKDIVPMLSSQCPTEIEIDKEKEKDKELETDKENSKTDFQSVVDLFHSICVSFPKIRSLSDARKKAIKARLKNYTIDDFKAVFEAAEASSFLKGEDGGWKASFDWLIKEANMLKVLEGNYVDKKKGKKEVIYGASGNLGQAEYDAIQKILGEPYPEAKTEPDPDFEAEAEKMRRRLQEVYDMEMKGV